MSRALGGKRVLVTGGLGFIGSNLAHRCLELGASVTIIDLLDPRSGGNMANIAAIRDRVRLVHTDVRSDAAAAAVRENDVLFNCAALTSHAGSAREPGAYVDVNVGGTFALLESARRASPGFRFVQLGTSTQIGRARITPVTEDHAEAPVDVYSATKSAAEKMVLAYASRMWVTAVRLANVYGPRASVRTPELGFMNYFIGLALQGRPITVYGDGSQLRDVAYVDDVVEALVGAACGDACRGAVFFAPSGRRHSVRQIADEIASVIGGRVETVPWPAERRAIEVGDAVLSGARIAEAIGWTARTELRDGLAATTSYYRRRLREYLT